MYIYIIPYIKSSTNRMSSNHQRSQKNRPRLGPAFIRSTASPGLLVNGHRNMTGK